MVVVVEKPDKSPGFVLDAGDALKDTTPQISRSVDPVARHVKQK